MPSSLQRRIRIISARLGFERDWYLVLVATVIGVLMGGVALLFIEPIRMVEHWAEHEAGQTMLFWLVPIAPVVGGLLTGLILYRHSSEAQGPGVSSVMYSIYREKGRLSFMIVPKKWIASTITICSGGSAGAEGPIVTIGAALGSSVGRVLRANPQTTTTLLGCGAAAGISSVFNAPFAGVFFVVEVLLRDFSLRTFIPIVIASVISSAWTQTMLGGNEPIFGVVPEFLTQTHFDLFEAPNFILLGLVCGAIAPIFIRSLFWADDLFARLRVPGMLKPAIGGAMLGLIGLGYLLLFRPEHMLPPFYANGYPVIQQLLDPAFYAPGGTLKPAAGLLFLLVILCVLKVVGTCITIGSGGSGGLFAPSLLLGAGVGGCFGVIVARLQWLPAANPAHYALVGMAAMIAALVHAPLTGILIVYELTRSYEVILPLMLAAVIATVVARTIQRDSVYSWKLTRKGVRIGAMSDLTILRRLSVSDVPLLKPVTLHPQESAQRLLDLTEEHAVSDFIVTDDRNQYLGMITGADLRTALLEREAIPLLLISELQRSNLPVVSPDDSLDVVLDKFARNDVHSLAVLDDATGQPIGLITRDRLMRTYQHALERD